MQLNRETENLSVNESFILKSQNGVECKLPYIEDEQAVISVSGKSYLTKYQSLEKEIKYEGRAIFTVLYKTEEGLKSVESGVEYGFKVQDDRVMQGQKITPSVSVNDCLVKTVNGVIMVDGILTFICQVDKETSVDFYSSSDDYVSQKQEVEYTKNLMTIMNEFKIEDEFELDYNVKNILCHSERACISNIETGISCVTVEGEIELSSVLLSLNDESIKRESKVIPFRIEIEGKEILPSSIANVTVNVIETNYKVLVDENKNKSVVNVEVQIQSLLDVYEKINVSYVSDVYSTEYQLSLTRERVETANLLGQEEVKQKYVSEIPFNLNESESLICSTNERVVELDTQIEKGKIVVNGVIESCLLLKGENGYYKNGVNLPFSVDFDGGEQFSKILDCKICQFEVKYNKNALKYQFILQLSIAMVEKSTNYVIIKVDQVTKRPKNESAISVYIPNGGDTLWDICKTLGVTEDTVLKTNSDLQFPLSKDDRIVIYREISKG